METAPLAPGSHLFLIRLWAQADAGDGPGWQGKVQPLLSGEAYCFADWTALVDLLVRLAGRPAPPEARREETAVE